MAKAKKEVSQEIVDKVGIENLKRIELPLDDNNNEILEVIVSVPDRRTMGQYLKYQNVNPAKAQEILVKNCNLKNSKEKIAIIITGWSKYFGSDKYFYENPYLSDELTELIIEKNFKGIAIDTCSVDKYGKDTNHKKLLENNVWIVENITNCDNLNKTSYSSFFIPLNIEAEASPVRAFLKKD